MPLWPRSAVILSRITRRMATATATSDLDNYIIVDIGANLTNKKFSRDLSAVIQRAKESGDSLQFFIKEH